MNFRVIVAILSVGLLSRSAPAQTVDMADYRPLPGLVAGRRSRPNVGLHDLGSVTMGNQAA
jgi:hypothetical protein